MSSLYGHDVLDTGEGGGPWPALSDLLAATTLIFCVLFAVTVVPAIRDRRKLADLRTGLDSLQTHLKPRDSGAYRIARVGDYLRITIGGDVVFPKNRYDLEDMRPEGRAKLADIGRALTREAALIDQVQIVGHTSSEGSDENNWRLSSARAGTVALFLVGQGGLPVCKVTALGRGRYYPLHPDSARAGAPPDPQDRRIELEIRPVVIGDTAQERRRRDCVEQVGDRRPRDDG